MKNSIEKTRYYSELLKKSDLETCKKAGFISEDLEDLEFYNNYGTDCFFQTDGIPQIEKLFEKELDLNKEIVVVLSTGSYSPVHDGHVQNIKTTVEFLKDKFNVLGAFMSPSHDNYVLNKYSTGVKFNIFERIKLLEDKLKGESINVLKWEGMYCKSDVNFTTVCDYLRFCIQNQINELTSKFNGFKKKDIKIVYVVGSDNADFSKVFNSDYCVIIQRPDNRVNPKDYVNDFVFVIESELKENISSTEIRKYIDSRKTLEFNPVFADDINISTSNKAPNRNIVDNQNKYLIRLSGIGGEKYFRDPLLNKTFLKYKKEFVKDFINIIKSGINENIKIVTSDYKDELIKLEQLKNVYGKDYINLDKCINSITRVRISRVFSMFNNQSDCLYYLNGSMNDFKLNQLDKSKTYWLFDDDISTGKTMEYVKEILSEKNINIHNIGCLFKDYYDVIDLRDFIIGSVDGGLYVDEYMDRVPYILPYVSLNKRAKIDINKELEISIKILELNLKLIKFHEKIYSCKVKNEMSYNDFEYRTEYIEYLLKNLRKYGKH